MYLICLFFLNVVTLVLREDEKLTGAFKSCWPLNISATRGRRFTRSTGI